jgi:hypothetical protein
LIRVNGCGDLALHNADEKQFRVDLQIAQMSQVNASFIVRI